MKLEDVRECYKDLSGKASEIARQLGFAAIAVVWVFKNDQAGKAVLPPVLTWVATCCVLGLGLDFLHYVWGSLLWGFYGRLQERRGKKASDSFRVPRWFNWPTLCLFWTKLVAIVVAYVLLLRFLSGIITGN